MSDIEVVKEALSKAVVRTVLGTKAQLASDAFKKQAEHVGLRKWTTVKIAHLVGYKDEAKIGGLAFLDSPKKAAGTATGDCPLGEQAPNALFLISTSKLHKLYSASNWREDDVSENLQGCVDKCMEAHGAGISWATISSEYWEPVMAMAEEYALAESRADRPAFFPAAASTENGIYLKAIDKAILKASLAPDEPKQRGRGETAAQKRERLRKAAESGEDAAKGAKGGRGRGTRKRGRGRGTKPEDEEEVEKTPKTRASDQDPKFAKGKLKGKPMDELKEALKEECAKKKAPPCKFFYGDGGCTSKDCKFVHADPG